MTPYLFTSARLGFRPWRQEDIPLLSVMNADAEVMAHFPAVLTPGETEAFVQNMQQKWEQKGYCYFAADRLDDGSFIGFIGLSDKTFPASFTPCVDIGWRLAKQAWGKGYATDGAIRCLQYAFEILKLETVYSMAPEVNTASVRVMQKAGMVSQGTFLHPQLEGYERLRKCVLYSATAPLTAQ